MSVLVVLKDCVGVRAGRFACGGVGVDGGGGEAGNGMDEGVFGFGGDGVGGLDGQVWADGDVGLGSQGVPDPPHAHLPDALDSGDGAQGLFGGVDQGGVDGVHQAAVDLAGGVLEDHDDGEGDEQADDGVGPAPADRDAAGAEQNGQGGEAVGAGVQAVGDQGGGADAATGADAVASHPFV